MNMCSGAIATSSRINSRANLPYPRPFAQHVASTPMRTPRSRADRGATRSDRGRWRPFGRVGLELLLLVVLVVGIDHPDVVRSTPHVGDRHHRGEHRVVLIVVLVHPVAPDGV